MDLGVFANICKCSIVLSSGYPYDVVPLRCVDTFHPMKWLDRFSKSDAKVQKKIDICKKNRTTLHLKHICVCCTTYFWVSCVVWCHSAGWLPTWREWRSRHRHPSRRARADAGAAAEPLELMEGTTTSRDTQRRTATGRLRHSPRARAKGEGERGREQPKGASATQRVPRITAQHSHP